MVSPKDENPETAVRLDYEYCTMENKRTLFSQLGENNDVIFGFGYE